ncbi:MAG: hypothetical protein P1U89_15375 [Verrucomicrobiales bacterium]|nr:hypothetical protein [Verrucomicrobiales bacterium]
MNTLKLAVLCGFSIFMLGCTDQSNLSVGGVPAVFMKSSGPSENKYVVSKFDPTHIETPRTRGQVKFGMNIEKNFKPSPKPKRKLPKKKEFKDPVPDAINSFRRSR